MGNKHHNRVDTSSSEELTHNPFAALAGADLPAADAAEGADARAADEARGDPARGDSTQGDRALRFEGKVVVRREKKGRGGKTVTRISGVAPADREPAMDRLKRALGCGASLEGQDVVLLGALVDRAADWLEAAGARRVSRSG
jgi:translation initiation factor 1 (eIF-1/SUI1)